MRKIVKGFKLFSMKKVAMVAVAAAMTLGANAQLLWKVSGNGLEKPTYIMGTHHIAPASMIDSIPGLNDAINECDAICGEVLQSEMTSPEMQMKMMQYAMAPADSTLSAVLTESQYKTVDSLLTAYTAGMANLSMLESMKPRMVTVSLAQLQSMQVFPEFSQTEQLDMTVQARGEQAGKELMAFETADFQLELLFGAPISEQAEGLVEMAEDPEKSAKSARELAEAYQAQDLDRVWQVMNDVALTNDSDLEGYERMIFSRNDTWVNQLKQIMPEKSLLVCVGAGHLPSDRGLIAQLRNAGYTVEPAK